MSVSKLFCLYDSAAECYLPPSTMASKGVALRSLMESLADPNHHITKNAKDFSLFYLGTFDPSNASFDLLKSPERIASAWELISQGKA